MEKLCIFYASKYHLSIVLLEYFKNKNTKKYTVNTFLENPIEDEINILSKKYGISINTINEVSFNSTKDIPNKKIELSSNMIFIVEGSLKYMRAANNFIKKEVYKNNIKDLKIINCYDLEKQLDFRNQILKDNNKIIYTTGEKNLTNLF